MFTVLTAVDQVETLTSALAALKAARLDSDSLDIELTSGQELVNIEGGGEDGQATRLVHALAVEVVALREDNVEKEVLLLGLQVGPLLATKYSYTQPHTTINIVRLYTTTHNHKYSQATHNHT